ncbi:probable serine/threonine-protein kinase kinX [Drosophila takahashii]|uniref:probable serine/threonine-protein kinase kinX n=1 Tax=Drosophila takahashii TaxID=29030 RepID=UPI001CF80958|nr:probable serine/threonine-protein kinase mps1 [Drosophila takahashii]
MCLLAAGASGETMIEVDENGDEYELKRFYIQGRQLSGDGSQSQCVVTRRKRSGRALQSGSVAGSGSGSVSVSSQPLKVEALPAKEHREGGAVLQEVENSNRRYVALTGVHLESPLHEEQEDVEENDDDDQEDDDEVEESQSSSKSQSNFVPAALALPLQQPQQQQQPTSAAHLNQGVSVVANAASHANVAEDAGIVVVQSHQPPKVNPDTHAVFELKPVQSDVDPSSAVSFYPFVQPWEVVDQYGGDDYDEDDYDEEEDYDDFHYGGYDGFFRDQPAFQGLGAYEEHIISEDQPVSTIASWVTGEDDSDIAPVVNKRPNRKNKNKKNQKNKNKNQKNRRQQQKKRKQEAQEEEELTTKRKQKKPQQQDKDKDQKKKKQDKDQKKKKPEQSLENQEVDATPIEVIKKPVAMDSESAVVSASSSSSTSSNSSGSNSTDGQKKKKKKKKPASSSSSSLSQRRTKKKKKQSSSSSSSISISSSNSNKRRRPSSNMGSSSSSSIGGYRRRRPQQQQQLQQQQRRRKTQQQKRRRQQQQQKRRRQQQQQRRRLRNKNRQFYGDEPIINCIYINKDAPTTTTPRPFWNILGRQSEAEANAKSVSPSDSSSEESPVDPVAQQAVLQAVRRNFNEFGGRKRTNLRFVS